MRAQDIMKLANSNSFDIFKLNQINENFYCLKHLVDGNLPSWEIVSQKSSFDEIMNLYHQSKSHNKYPILYWNELSTFDILAIINCGFHVWRENYDSNISIQEFDKNCLKWKLHKEFTSLQEKNIYLNRELLDERIIVID